MEDLSRQVSRLSTSTTGPRRNRNRRRGPRVGAPPSGSVRPLPPKFTGAHVFTVARQEIFATLSGQEVKNSYPLWPSADSLPWLNHLMGSFSRYQWEKLHVYYKGGVGANTNGRLAAGFDGNSKEAPKERSKVLTGFPVMDVRIWDDTQDRPMIFSKELLQSRLQYIISADDPADKGIGWLKVFANGITGDWGELWIDYKIHLIAPD